MAFEIRYYNNSQQDDIEFVTEMFFWDTLYIRKSKVYDRFNSFVCKIKLSEAFSLKDKMCGKS